MSGALIVAIVAVGLSAASIAWQASTFLLSGARVKVELRYGHLDSRSGDSVLLPFPPHGSRPDNEPEPGYIAVVALAVTNSGRTDVDIASWGLEFELDEKAWMYGASGGLNPPLPHRLLHGSQRGLYLADADVQSAVDGLVAPKSVEVCAFVSLGNGKSVRTASVVLEKSSNA